PETMLGDTAVAVNPDDERYSDMIGTTVILPLMEREIPVIADDYIDTEFGTGALKVTPAHDPNDLAIAQRHDLESVLAINRDGEMTEACGEFAGMDRYEAREAVVQALDEQGLLEEVDDYSHSVGHCSRCGTVVEPLVSMQWFVEMEPLAELGLQAVDDGEVSFVPERWEKVYRDWLENIRDWCISRQLWWGHPIPVWYCDDCGEMTCERQDPTECAHCGSSNIEQETDVLDTWFSSALWPFATLGWPEKTEDLDYFHPTSVLVTGYDIIYFWVARMVMMSKHMMGEHPFDTVFIHGLVRDETGTKMSKSLGNVVDPLELIDKYGADALRFALLQMITHGQDLTYSEDRIVGARNFCNKLWNAARFVMMNLDGNLEPVDLSQADLTLPDRWILSRNTACLQTLTRQLDRFNLAQAADVLYEHVWSEFCDWYLELAKPDLYAEGNEARTRVVQTILQHLLSNILRALHPFTPFVTEEIWQSFVPQTGSISVQPYPQPDETLRDEEIERQMWICQSVVVTVRNLRATLKLPPQQKMTVTLQAEDDVAEMLARQEQGISTLASLEALHVQTMDEQPPEGALGDVAEGVKVFLHIEGAVDPEEELKRLQKEMQELQAEKKQSEGKLSNEGFVNNAPDDVVEKEKRRLEETDANIARLDEQIEAMRSLAE
ncbi:MAG: valine--tRNA ligase, partial [Armatimonadota bacterium]